MFGMFQSVPDSRETTNAAHTRQARFWITRRVKFVKITLHHCDIARDKEVSKIRLGIEGRVFQSIENMIDSIVREM